MKDLDALQGELDAAESPEEWRLARSKVFPILSSLNQTDREVVALMRGVVGSEILPNMERMARDLEAAGVMGKKTREQFLKYRKDVENMLMVGAQIVQMVRRVGDNSLDLELAQGASREATELEETNGFMYSSVRNAFDVGDVSGGDISAHMSHFENLYARLGMVDTLLEQERLGFVIGTYKEVADVALGYLESDSFKSAFKMPTEITMRMGDRSSVMKNLRMDTRYTSSVGVNTSSFNGSGMDLDALANGDFDW